MPSASPIQSLWGAHSSSGSSDTQSSSESSSGDQHPLKARVKKGIRKVKGKIGVKPPGRTDEEPEKNDIIDEKMNDVPAFNLDRLQPSERASTPEATHKTVRAMQRVGKSLIHPQQSAKKKAKRVTAKGLARTERTYLPQSADAEYLEAHESLREAESSGLAYRSSSEDGVNKSIEERRTRIHEMEAERQSLRAAWMTSRHVYRVRAIPGTLFDFPSKATDINNSSDADSVSARRLRWLGHVLLYFTQDFSKQYIDDTNELPFDLDVTRRYLERIVMASSVWQSWLLDIRAVYRWENPRSTAKWLALYVVLWYTQHMMGFVYAFVIYMVLKRKFYPSKLESLRASTERAHDSRRKARKLIELVDRHGSHNWLEPVMEQMGPYAQLQLCDLANLLEVLSAFYEWERPSMTLCSLAFFGSCLLVTLLTDMAYCMKIVWFIIGGTFFFCWPISSLYPRYRYLVSPFKWIFWNIPTRPEWSFLYLRREATKMQSELTREKGSVENNGKKEGVVIGKARVEDDRDTLPTYESADEEWDTARSTCSIQIRDGDIRSFSGYSKKARGWLVVSWTSIRFVNIITQTESWRLQSNELISMRKVESGSRIRPSNSRRVLELDGSGGQSFSVQAMRERDEAFNTIIAFSGIQWQSLQPQSG